jgi:hypothetical protein
MAMRSIAPFTREALGLVCPLVFSVTGLLLDGVVLVGFGDQLAPAWRFALVAGAPALAAIAAMKTAGDDRLYPGSGNHFGRR